MAKKTPTLDLRALQLQWYKKLKKNGFVDIEKNGNLTQFDSKYFIHRYKGERYFEKEIYYISAGRFLNDYKNFKNKVEKKIWAMHSAGETIREIGNKLGKKKSTVDYVIQRLKEIMLKNK